MSISADANRDIWFYWTNRTDIEDFEDTAFIRQYHECFTEQPVHWLSRLIEEQQYAEIATLKARVAELEEENQRMRNMIDGYLKDTKALFQSIKGGE